VLSRLLYRKSDVEVVWKAELGIDEESGLASFILLRRFYCDSTLRDDI
jgi:hypothetical protein